MLASVEQPVPLQSELVDVGALSRAASPTSAVPQLAEPETEADAEAHEQHLHRWHEPPYPTADQAPFAVAASDAHEGVEASHGGVHMRPRVQFNSS